VWYGMLNTLGIFDVSSLNPVQEHFHPPRPGIILPGLQMCMHYDRRPGQEGDVKRR